MGDLSVLWGKSGEAGQPHSLLAHMIDAGMVARAVLRAPQHRRLARLLTRLGGFDGAAIDQAVPFLVALHDLGKAAPGFQRLAPSLWDAVQAEGFSDCHPLWSGVRFRHDVEGYAALADSVLPALITVASDESPRRRRHAIAGLAQAVGAHHGSLVSDAEVSEFGYPQVAHDSTAAGDQAWITARQELVSEMARVFEVSSPMAVASGHLSALCLVLNGLTILCDWVASSEEFFPCAVNTAGNLYAAESWSLAQNAVKSAGLLRFPSTPADVSFSALFPQLTARPLQAALDSSSLIALGDPMLAVIEAPTGEGKTEAALLLAQRLIAQTGGGLYFALPTMATSEQLFARVAAFFADNYPGDGETGAMLVHGQVELSPAVQLITARSTAGDSERTNPVVIDSWFLPRKRALLAPFAVGTVDQAMLAALRVRHGSLRLVGLAGKVVIIDEIHAYDAYMSVIIERLLEWLAELGVSVILLSATLTQAMRRRLLCAYGVQVAEDREPNAYPLITLARPHHKPDCIEPPASGRARSIAIALVPAEEQLSSVTDCVDAAARGAAVGWVCDTVGSAQATFEKVRALLSALPADERPRAVLYHARMLAGQRRRVEEEVELLVGKQGTRKRGCVVVATQVVEQSLDIDFDLLFSELAPVDLIIQRIGRLHRHDRARPAHVAKPCCRILMPPRLGGAEPASPIEWVYQPFVLIKTLVALLNRRRVDVPADVRTLVEAVYDDVVPEAASLERLGVSASAAGAAWSQLHAYRQTAADAARMFVLGPPNGRHFTAAEGSVPLLDDLGDDDVLERESIIGAQTRLSGPSARVVLLECDEELLSDTSLLFRDKRLPTDVARWLLDRSVSISHPALLAHVAAAPSGRAPKAFAKTAALRSHTLLRISGGVYQWQSQGRAWRLCVDETLGVVIERVGG